MLAAGPNAVLSHESAAKHWRIWRGWVEGIDVLVPGNRRARPGVRVHRARALDRRDVTIHRGIPITTPARTLVDLTSVLTHHQLANVIHEAAYRQRFDNGAVRDTALQAHASGSAGTKSALEGQFLETWQGPEPLVNTKIEVDMYWPDQDLVVEIDGPGHERPRTRNEDAARDAALKAAGIATVRLPSGHG